MGRTRVKIVQGETRMKKKLVLFATLVLAVVLCLSALVGCDGSARNVKHIGCDDYLYETGVSVTLSKRLSKAARWNSDMHAIKFKKSIAELFELMQMQEGYVKTLYDDYILIEKAGDDKLYTWGIFPMSAWSEGYDGEYDYVLTTMGCSVDDGGYATFFFPIYAMERPLLHWANGKSYAFNMTIDELDEFYTQHGFTTVILDNILTVSTPIKKDCYGNEHSSSWEVTFQFDGTVSVDNFLEQVTVYD